MQLLRQYWRKERKSSEQIFIAKRAIRKHRKIKRNKLALTHWRKCVLFPVGGVGCLSSELLPAAYVYIPERQKKIIKLLTNAHINSVKFAAITTVFPILVRILISYGSCSFRQWLSKCYPKKFFFQVFLFTETRHLLYCM